MAWVDRSMIRIWSGPQQGPERSDGNCETLLRINHRSDYASAEIAAIAWQIRRGNRRMEAPDMPPNAATGTPARRASWAQRNTPSGAASGWLAVANTGDRKTKSAPARRARRASARVCAELVVGQRPGLPCPARRPARRCTPAPSAAASRASPATTNASRRCRQIAARARPNAGLAGSSSWRNTTPARPRGSRATAVRGSGRRRESVNSHSGGKRRWRRDTW
jgi:hypothetical protein